MKKQAIAVAAMLALTVIACGKSGETENSGYGTPSTTTTEQSEQSVAETGAGQDTIQPEQAAFEAAGSTGNSESTDATSSGESQ
jgi:hypothetical protein